MAGSFLGRSWSSSPELIAFRFKAGHNGQRRRRRQSGGEKENAGGPTVTFSWSVCSLGKRDILRSRVLRRRTTLRLNPNRVLTSSCDFVFSSRASLTTMSDSEAAPPIPSHTEAKFKVSCQLDAFGCQSSMHDPQAREVYTKVAE
jgi:hypothetical protein